MREYLYKIKQSAYITYILTFLIIAAFILEEVNGGPTPYNVFRWGAVYKPAVLAGQDWRLIVALFLHNGIVHIICNAVSLVWIGIYAEPSLGHVKYLITFLITGVIGNLFSCFLGSGFSAGASTAIFGLMGALISICYLLRKNPGIKALLYNLALVAVGNLVFDLGVPGISLSGHIGGLIAGIVLGGAIEYRNVQIY